jgi:ATP-dependent Clp protease, protease subunit
VKQDLNRILSAHTGKPVDELKTDTDRDYFMSGEEARTYGIVDHVISKRDDLGDGAATEKKDDA